jgi:hypothetical protein
MSLIDCPECLHRISVLAWICPGCGHPVKRSSPDRQSLIEAWKQTVAVQMHFNEIAMKIRAFALTLIAALLTAGSFSTGPPRYWVVVAALISWGAFYLMDRWWYHYLLLGAVLHGIDLEDLAAESGLTLESAEGSGRSMLGLAHRIGTLNQEGWKLKAKYKIDGYYAIVTLALLILLVVRWRFT